MTLIKLGVYTRVTEFNQWINKVQSECTNQSSPIATTNTTIIITASTMTTTSTSTTSRTPSKTCGKNFGDLEYTPKYPKVSILTATGQIKQRENFFPGSSSKYNTLSQGSKL